MYLLVHLTVYTSSLRVRETWFQLFMCPISRWISSFAHIILLYYYRVLVYMTLSAMSYRTIYSVVFEGLTYTIDYCHPTFSLSSNRCDDGACNPTCELLLKLKSCNLLYYYISAVEFDLIEIIFWLYIGIDFSAVHPHVRVQNGQREFYLYIYIYIYTKKDIQF